ncbi:hypothetical protein [Mycolicibacterium mucogenicum]|nr:hypothetical protein [Mycolicibacterium mucogenicum]
MIWARFPQPLRETFRRAAWLLINTPLPAALLDRDKSNAIEWYSGSSIRTTVMNDWLIFANWLQQNAITQLRDVTRSDFENYAKHVQASTSRPWTKRRMLRCVSRLWAYTPYLPASDALPMPAWDDEPVTDFISITARSGENTTPIIHPSTMAPLLLWSQRFLTLADDITAAANRWRILLAATPVNRSLRSHHAAAALVQHWIANGTTVLPAKANRGKRTIDFQYLCAIHGHINPEDLSRAITDSGHEFRLDFQAPTPVDSPVEATIDGKPWCSGIDYKDLRTLQQSVIAAALVIVAYLTGMRPHEVLALPPDCIQRHRISAAVIRYSVRGRKYKRVRRDGRTDPNGQERTWTTIEPVAEAIDTLKHSFPDHAVLFPSARDGAIPLNTADAGPRIATLIDTANALTQRLGLPEAYAIPADPAGPISLRRFRRTLAWHIRRLPHGKVALAIQYGHLSIAQGEGYSGLSDAGFAALMTSEESSALVDTIEQARRDLEDGEGVSGPAAKRLINVVKRFTGFEGTYLSDKDARRLKADTSLRVYDNPDSFLTCMFDPHRALCQRTANRHVTEPRLDDCQRGCSNIARTDRHISSIEHEVQRLRSEADNPLTPKPLAHRLQSRADAFATIIEEHRASAITTTRPEDPKPPT